MGRRTANRKATARPGARTHNVALPRFPAVPRRDVVGGDAARRGDTLRDHGGPAARSRLSGARLNASEAFALQFCNRRRSAMGRVGRAVMFEVFSVTGGPTPARRST